MTWPWLSEVIEHRLVVDDAEIAPAPDAVVRAIDVRGRFAAVYMLSVDERGRWSDDCLIAWKYRGGWESPSSGGAHGEREPPPWRRPTKWWKGRAFGLSGIAGCELPLDDDGEEMVLVRGLYGIATRRVAAIKVVDSRGTHTAEVASSGRFAAIALGDQTVEMQPVDSEERPIGEAITEVLGARRPTRLD